MERESSKRKDLAWIMTLVALRIYDWGTAACRCATVPERSINASYASAVIETQAAHEVKHGLK